GLPGADEFGNPVRIESLEPGDGGFGDDDPGRVQAEIVAAMDQTRHTVHQDAAAPLRHDIEDDVPTLARGVAGPIIVADHDAPVPGVTAGGHESAAMLGRGALHAA